MNLTSELLELSHHLQQEHLFVTTEREQLQRLYHSVTILSERLFHTAWIARQQKQNLQHFIDQGTNSGESVEVYSTNNQLEDTNFVDSYKVFSYHDSKYGELLRFLYENPKLLANVINVAEKVGGLSVQRMISLAVTSIFGNCIFQEDEKVVLCLLKTLLGCQLTGSENPRRLIRRQNLSFSLVYKHMCETLFSARLFLTATLYEPIMRLLMEDEWFFDIDPDKALVRFPPGEKLRRFGEPGTEEYNLKQAQYRSFIVDKLVMLAVKFINSIKANMHCFPASLGWLVSQVYRVLTGQGQVSMQEVRVCCADLVFALFICPAICDPEPHGITSDVPISHIARHNLMQMAQIIQVLAISQFEEIDPKVRDLYSRFEKGCMTSVLDIFLEGPWEDVTEQISSDRQKASVGTTRSAVLLTPKDVREMVGFLRNTTVHLNEATPNKKSLEQLLSALPADMPPSSVDVPIQGSGGVLTPSPTGTGSSNPTPDTPGTPNSERKLFKSKGYRKKRSSTSVAPSQFDEVLGENTDSDSKSKSSTDVLVISIYPPGDYLGMLPEKKVLSAVHDSEVKKGSSHPGPPSDSVPIATPQVASNPEIQEKRTRFSLSHDQESIGNASDYQEVISEAASSHSVEDENELETDNFSDMMSANVSGRGSPSISGRDTPLSQAGSVEENPPAPQLPVPVPETVRKENRVDVTERFGKFEIKAELAMERDECKSTVSDTWSTDVLASDSEPPEQNQVDRLEEVAEEITRPLLLGSEPISEISETASDAWSTDVLASDTEEKHSELLKDLEQDLIGGALDRDEGDSSLGHEEIDETAAELDQLGAVGGCGNCQLSSQGVLESLDNFSDVFVENQGKSGDENERNGNGKKMSNIVHHFQSGPNLQLPSIHRPPSQSLKHTEGRVTTVVGTFESNSPTGSSATSTSTVIHPSTGARSKVRDKKKEREGRLSIGGKEEGVGEFDPLVSGAGGRRRSKDRWPWNKNSKPGSDHHKLPHSDEQDLSAPGTTTGNHDFPAPPSAGRGGHTSSRDSGIDIWVSTNGQMSGSSSRSPSSALVNPRSSFDSVTQRQTAPTLPGRSSLDSTLQRLHSTGGGGMMAMSPTADSGVPSSYISSTVSSSLDNNTPPLEIDNPLFHLLDNETSGDNHSPSDRGGSIFVNTSNQQDHSSSQVSNNEESLMMRDSQVEDGTMFADSSEDKYQYRKLRRSGPQIEVTDIFTNISVVAEDRPDLETPNTGEQRLSNVSERRLSSALTLFDPFAPDADNTSVNLSTTADLKKDFSFDSSVKFDDQENKLHDSNDSLFSKKSNGAVVLVDEGQKLDQGAGTNKGHSRQDSSGSSQSASSLKLNTTYETSAKQQTTDLLEDKDLADGDKNRKTSSVGFLRSMKDKFNKGIKRKNAKSDKDQDIPDGDSVFTPKPAPQASFSKDGPALPNADGTDDILAKYRTPKKPAQPKTNNTGSSNLITNNTGSSNLITNNNTSSVNNNTSKSEYTEVTAVGCTGAATFSQSTRNSLIDAHQLPYDGGPPFFDRDNLEGCAAFQDAKRKLRLVLSMADISFGRNQIHSSSPRDGTSLQENEFINILNAQLAEAINLQNKDLVAQLYEVIRCMKMFNADGCKKLIHSMKEDYCSRSPYISYLVRCRQGLLSTRNQLHRLMSRVNRDKEICSKHLTNMCARNFLEKREKIMWRFISEFQKLSMSDEKIDLVERFLQSLYQEMSTDALWKAANSAQIEDGQQAIERFLMSRIYTHAMFPNGDGDIMRDQLLQEHLRKLSKVISPSHKDLRIPSMYHLECPWPAAQKEIYMINAYRTPKDKIRCVLRCSQTIMNLLSMANEKSVPAADDFMPVLIFVLIKANPFGLLSTIQYVNSFYEKRLHGEEQYWWLQLTSAVEFIKTMDYST